MPRRQRVLMLVKNAFRPDPRVLNEARVLVERHDVDIWAFDPEGGRPRHEEVAPGIRVRRFGMPGTRWLNAGPTFLQRGVLGKLATRLRSLSDQAIMWSSLVRGADYAVVHCHDLDTLALGLALATRLRARCVFDAHEDFAAFWAYRFGPAAAAKHRWLERVLIDRVDAVIVVGERMREEYRRRTLRPVHLLGNWKDPAAFVADEAVVDPRVRAARARGQLVISFLSGLSRNRPLEPLIAAAAQQDQVFLVVAGGMGDDYEREIRGLLAPLDNAVYLGWLEPSAVNSYFVFSDAVIYCLDPSDPNNYFSTPNTLFSALSTGTPLITTAVGEIGWIAESSGAGVILDDLTPEAANRALETLLDSGAREVMAAAALEASASYSLSRFRDTLFELYDGLLGPRGGQP